MATPSSVRLHIPPDLHTHADLSDESGRVRLVASADGECTGRVVPVGAGMLWRENGKVMFRGPGNEGATAVRVIWTRPLSGRGGPVSLVQAGKKREVAYFENLADIPESSRRIAEEELERSVILPKIIRVNQVRSRFGNHYWNVETDIGPRRFLLTSPENSTYRPLPGVIVLKDVSGNCYEIPDVSKLDKASLREMSRVL